jgi:hypothetical protein
VLRRLGECLLLPALVLSLTSCTRLQRAGTPGEGGELAIEALPPEGAVPLEWGDPIAVTPSPDVEGARLWFLNEAGVIRVVGYDYRSRRLWPRAGVIRRIGGGEQ